MRNDIPEEPCLPLDRHFDADLAAWRGRSLAEHVYPYLAVDARYEYVPQGGQVISEGVLIC